MAKNGRRTRGRTRSRHQRMRQPSVKEWVRRMKQRDGASKYRAQAQCAAAARQVIAGSFARALARIPATSPRPYYPHQSANPSAGGFFFCVHRLYTGRDSFRHPGASPRDYVRDRNCVDAGHCLLQLFYSGPITGNRGAILSLFDPLVAELHLSGDRRRAALAG